MMEIPPPKQLQAFLGMINDLSKFSPSTADTCEALRELTSVKREWTWNADYQKLFDKAKSKIKVDTCMKFYDETKPLYLEADASGGGLGAGLLQTRNGTRCLSHGTRQQHTQTHHICKQKSIQCRGEIQQYRKRSIRYITWPGKILLLLFCKRGGV